MFPPQQLHSTKWCRWFKKKWIFILYKNMISHIYMCLRSSKVEFYWFLCILSHNSRDIFCFRRSSRSDLSFLMCFFFFFLFGDCTNGTTGIHSSVCTLLSLIVRLEVFFDFTMVWRALGIQYNLTFLWLVMCWQCPFPGWAARASCSSRSATPSQGGHRLSPVLSGWGVSHAFYT